MTDEELDRSRLQHAGWRARQHTARGEEIPADLAASQAEARRLGLATTPMRFGSPFIGYATVEQAAVIGDDRNRVGRLVVAFIATALTSCFSGETCSDNARCFELVTLASDARLGDDSPARVVATVTLADQVEVWLKNTAFDGFTISVKANGLRLQQAWTTTATGSAATAVTVFDLGDKDLPPGAVIEVTSTGLKGIATAEIKSVTTHPCRECLK